MTNLIPTTPPRVTQIISDIYPFPDIAREKWINSINEQLVQNNLDKIAEIHLMKLTQQFGDMIHHYFICKVMDFPAPILHVRYKDYQIAIDTFIAERNVKGIICEQEVIKPGEYVGHLDLVCEFDYNGSRIRPLADVKTYASYKHILGLPDTDIKQVKMMGNSSKVSLQTSMYRDALHATLPEFRDVTQQFCFHVTHKGVFLYPLKYNVDKYLLWLTSKEHSEVSLFPQESLPESSENAIRLPT